MKNLSSSASKKLLIFSLLIMFVFASLSVFAQTNAYTVSDNQTIEFGYGVSGKEVSAGKIGYERFTPGALDIVGAGTLYANRKIKLWAEGGLLIDGNVGIGISTPAAKLDLGLNSGLALKIEPNIGNVTYVGRHQNNSLGFDWANGQLLNSTYALTFNIDSNNDDTASYIDFKKNGNDFGSGISLLKILENGNVGIGTTTPAHKLHVNGGFMVENNTNQEIFHVASDKELVFIGDSAHIQYQTTLGIDTSAIQQNNYSLWVSKGIVSENYAIADVHEWDDYVFDENYDLPNLEKVAAFIEQNKHLPNIPSESQVKLQGYNLHKMNRNFLKTIEELMLYTIEQNDKIKALEAKVEQYQQLTKEVEYLKSIIMNLDK